jgi:hypothetical protein
MFIRSTFSFTNLHPWRTDVSALCVGPTSQKERPTPRPDFPYMTGVTFKWVNSQDYVPCTLWASCLLTIHVFLRMTQNWLAGNYRRLEELCVSIFRNHLKMGRATSSAWFLRMEAMSFVNYLPIIAASDHRRFESSSSPLFEHRNTKFHIHCEWKNEASDCAFKLFYWCD